MATTTRLKDNPWVATLLAALTVTLMVVGYLFQQGVNAIQTNINMMKLDVAANMAYIREMRDARIYSASIDSITVWRIQDLTDGQAFMMKRLEKIEEKVR